MFQFLIWLFCKLGNYQHGVRKAFHGRPTDLIGLIDGTDLADEYRRGELTALSKEEYIDLLIDCLENLSPDVVVHRLTGDGPSKLLLAPMWSTRKREVLNEIHREMKLRESFQGKCFMTEH